MVILQHPSTWHARRKAAETPAGLHMPDVLAAYRLPYEDMTLRFMGVGSPHLLEDAATLSVFNNALALAQAYDHFLCFPGHGGGVTRSFDEMAAFQGSL